MKQLIGFLIFVFALTAFAGEKSITLNVKGMTCSACVNTVEKALKSVKGVKEAKVDLQSNSATVMLTSDDVGSADLLVKAVSDAGFTASEGKTEAKQEEMKKRKSAKEGDCCDDGGCKDMKKTKMKKHGKIKAEAKKS